jgi:hypothetical protein
VTTPEIADWTAVHDLVPDALDAIVAIQHAVEETVDREMLELTRVRVATVLGVPPIVAGNWSAALEQKVAVLSDWPTSPLFSASERSRLSLAEQFVIDVNGVTDTMVAAVLDDLGPSGTYAFVYSVWAVESFTRACSTLGVRPEPSILKSPRLPR